MSWMDVSLVLWVLLGTQGACAVSQKQAEGDGAQPALDAQLARDLSAQDATDVSTSSTQSPDAPATDGGAGGTGGGTWSVNPLGGVASSGTRGTAGVGGTIGTGGKGGISSTGPTSAEADGGLDGPADASASGGSDGAPVGDGGGSTAPGTSAPFGVFELHYVQGSSPAASYTDITGIMRDGTPTELVLWEKKDTEGDCSLYIPRVPFCESCASPMVCVADNLCLTPPSSHSVGKVTLTGLNPPSGAKPLELTPITTAVGTNYLCGEILPVPPCTVGGAIRLDAIGAGEFPAFSIAGQCIAPLAVGNATVAIESGKDFTLTWTPGTVAEARIGLELDLSHHGGSKGRLVCESADTGTLKVSGKLIKELIDLGVTGFPKAEITRVFTAKTVVGSGQAEMRLRSDMEFLVEVPGLKSCNTSADCTAPETCQVPGMMCGISCTKNTECPTGKTCLTATKICS